MEPPSRSRSFLVFHSSLHISQNTLSINRLTLTEHPLIHLSAVLPSCFQICLQHLFAGRICPAGRSFTNERRLRGWWHDVHSQPEPPSTGRFSGRWKEEGRNNISFPCYYDVCRLPIKCSPSAFFRFHFAMKPLPLAIRLPLLGCHPYWQT